MLVVKDFPGNLIRDRVLLAATIVAVVACSWFLHRNAGLSLPIPWADECTFVFPAINVAEHNKLLTPELNPERRLFLMPPAYSMLLGVVLKVFPYSLGFVRVLSWICTIFLFVGLLSLLNRTAPKSIVIVLAALFLLGSNFIVAGNMARMDAMLLSCVCWGWCLMLNGKRHLGIGLLLASPLIHPSGVYYVIAGVAYVLLIRKSLRPSSVREFLPVAVALVLIVMYMLYIFHYLPAFMADMQFQIERKVSRNILQRLLDDPLTRSMAVAYPIALLTSAKIFPAKLPLLLFGAISLAVQLVGLEMWYHIYVAVAALILMTALIGMMHEMLQRTEVRTIPKYSVVALTGGLLMVWAHGLGFISSPTRYPDKLSWIGMRMDPDGRYVTHDERNRLVNQLNVLSTGETTRVSFDPQGDALVVWSSGDSRFTPYYPMFTNIEPDIVVVHVSDLLPRWWKSQTRETMKRWQVTEEDLFFVSDDGDRWYVKSVGRDRLIGQ